MKSNFSSQEWILHISLMHQIMGYVLLQFCFYKTPMELECTAFLIVISVRALLDYLWMLCFWWEIQPDGYCAGSGNFTIGLWTIVSIAEYILNVSGMFLKNCRTVYASFIVYVCLFELLRMWHRQGISGKCETVCVRLCKNRRWFIVLSVCSMYIMTGLGILTADAEEMAEIMVVQFFVHEIAVWGFMSRWKVQYGHAFRAKDEVLYTISYGSSCLVGVLSKTDLFCRYFYNMDEQKAGTLGILFQCLVLLGAVKVLINNAG